MFYGRAFAHTFVASQKNAFFQSAICPILRPCRSAHPTPRIQMHVSCLILICFCPDLRGSPWHGVLYDCTKKKCSDRCTPTHQKGSLTRQNFAFSASICCTCVYCCVLHAKAHTLCCWWGVGNKLCRHRPGVPLDTYNHTPLSRHVTFSPITIPIRTQYSSTDTTHYTTHTAGAHTGERTAQKQSHIRGIHSVTSSDTS
jgi:hypothetical protein